MRVGDKRKGEGGGDTLLGSLGARPFRILRLGRRYRSACLRHDLGHISLEGVLKGLPLLAVSPRDGKEHDEIVKIELASE